MIARFFVIYQFKPNKILNVSKNLCQFSAEAAN